MQLQKTLKWSRLWGIFLMFLLILGGSVQARGLESGTPAYNESLLKDLAERKALPQTDVLHSQWYTAAMVKGWGPMPRLYPEVEHLLASLPPGTDAAQWKRDRVIAIAKHYIGLPYRHHHIPAWSPEVSSQLNPHPGPGLDCSNFTAWVYNFGFGVALHGDVEKQSQMEPRPGYTLPHHVRRISAEEGFLPGDLLYIFNPARTAIAHVVLYIDEEHIIDSTGTQVNVRKFSGWYKKRLSHAIRIFG